MNWREKIICDWPNDLQKAARCRTALQTLDRTLQELASLGHPLHIEEGYVPPPPPGWPKAAFHILAGARSVNCQEDWDELGPDWYPTMEEARYAAGYAKQMQRGGIFDRSMPTLASALTGYDRQRNGEEKAAEKAEVKKLADDTRAMNRAKQLGNTQDISSLVRRTDASEE